MTSNLGAFSSKYHGLGDGRLTIAGIAAKFRSAIIFLASILDDALLHFTHVNKDGAPFCGPYREARHARGISRVHFRRCGFVGSVLRSSLHGPASPQPDLTRTAKFKTASTRQQPDTGEGQPLRCLSFAGEAKSSYEAKTSAGEAETSYSAAIRAAVAGL